MYVNPTRKLFLFAPLWPVGPARNPVLSSALCICYIEECYQEICKASQNLPTFKSWVALSTERGNKLSVKQ